MTYHFLGTEFPTLVLWVCIAHVVIFTSVLMTEVPLISLLPLFYNPYHLHIQGEHKVFPCLQTSYKKTTWNTNKYFLTLIKLVSKILCHVFIVLLQLYNLLVSTCRQWRRKPSVSYGITKQNHLLSIRRSPYKKRSTCWSVLMCCKKTPWVTFKKYICLYSTYSSFRVINVCNQGTTLCSPCILEISLGSLYLQKSTWFR